MDLEESNEQVNEMVMRSDSVQAFINEHIIFTENDQDRLTTNDLFAAFQKYLKSEGEKYEISKRVFAMKFADAVICATCDDGDNGMCIHTRMHSMCILCTLYTYVQGHIHSCTHLSRNKQAALSNQLHKLSHEIHACGYTQTHVLKPYIHTFRFGLWQ
jgi:hypothetical protein